MSVTKVTRALAGAMLLALSMWLFGTTLVGAEDTKSHVGVAVEKGGKWWLGIQCQDQGVQPYGDPGPIYFGAGMTYVFPHSPAEKAKLQVGQLIVYVDKTRVHNCDEFSKALQSSNGTVTLTVWDWEQYDFIPVKDIKLKEIPPEKLKPSKAAERIEK